MPSLGLGLGLGLGSRSGGAAVFNPATLSHSLLYLPDYAYPWAGAASAGSSSGRNLTNGTAGFRPAAGTGVNSHVSADCDGTDDYLDAGITTAVALSASASTVWFIAKANTVPADSGIDYDQGTLFVDAANGEQNIGITDAGLKCAYFAGAYKVRTVACATGAWFFGCARHSGGQLALRVNNTWSADIACGNLTYLGTGAVRVGKGYGAYFFDGEILAYGVSDTAFTNGEVDSLYSYFLALTA